MTPQATPLEVARPRSSGPRFARARLLTGFSLIEMMVVLTIFGIMSAVVLANFPAFRDKAALDLIAQEIATTIRQAQVYGIGTRGAGTASFSSHGIYFDLSSSDSFGLDNKSFYLYGDQNFNPAMPDETKGFTPWTQDVKNCGPIDGGDDCAIEKFTIRGGAEISGIFGCNESPCETTTSLLDLDIFFQRFYPEASFPGLSPSPSYIKIVIKSTRNETNQRAITVWNTGQIVVEKI